ncbi:WD repeat-containing protein 91, partial [Coemansia nantahalensis]
TVFPAMAVPRIMLFDRDRQEKDALRRKVAVYEEHLRGETRITAMSAATPPALVEDHIGGVPAAAGPRTPAAVDAAPAAGAASGDGPGAASGGDDVCADAAEPDVIQTDEPPGLLKISQEDIFLEHNAGVSLARFSATGSVIASYDEESVLKVWSPDAGTTAPKLKNELDYTVSAMAWDRRHTHLLYLYDEDGCIRTLNTNTNLMSRQTPPPPGSRRHPWIQCMLASPASSALVTVCSAKPESTADAMVRVWDAGAGKEVAARRLASGVESQGVSAAINHNSNLVALAHSTGAVSLIDARSLETVGSVKTRRRDLCAIEFSLDEDSLMVVSETGGLTQWSLRRNNQMLAESTLAIGAADGPSSGGGGGGGGGGVAADSRLDVDRVVFTPDRESIIVAPRSQCLVFNIDSATQTDCTRRHRGLIYAVDYAADKSLSACEDGTIH